MIRTVIASDFTLFREGLARIFASAESIELVGVAGNDIDLMTLITERSPQIAVVDMAIARSRDLIAWIQSAGAETGVVALGVREVEEEVIACASAGVMGYVPRDGSIEDLLSVVRSTANGELLCSPKIAGALLRHVATLSQAGAALGPEPELTAREQEVAVLIDRGMSNKEIARHLNIEVSTVKNHVHHLLEKLGVHRRSHAAARIRRKLSYRKLVR